MCVVVVGKEIAIIPNEGQSFVNVPASDTLRKYGQIVRWTAVDLNVN